MSYFLEKINNSIKTKDHVKILSQITLIKRIVSFITIIKEVYINKTDNISLYKYQKFKQMNKSKKIPKLSKKFICV